METKQLKAYAPQARQDFIAAVTHRAGLFGLTRKEITPVVEQGDVALINDQAHPKAVGEQQKKLAERMHRQGFDQVIEAVAYTWFNRLVAIRYMEVHGYLDHGYRVLSHPQGEGQPEILEHATEVNFPGVDRQQVLDLKLDGKNDESLYRLLLIGQCHALHQAMPFLFETLDDATELLLPDRLLHTDSLLRGLVESIDEDAWQSIEIIGWLYQFYISEKKDQVIGKVVKSEDIPAATQLFTPNWIVKYMVQNSLGAQWLATYPQSPLKGRMEFYIEPAEQTEEVQAQLAAITPSSLHPEELTLIDPACGSGHILVEAYDLFMAIYLERGYRPRDVPKLILEKNLFGLDIDDRAAQLTAFGLMMKGRADDRRLFSRGVRLNVQAMHNSDDFDPEALAEPTRLAELGLAKFDLAALKELFAHARTFGSLIQVPDTLALKLPVLQQLGEAEGQALFEIESLKRLRALVRQAQRLAARYDAVVANPPYMGSGGMNGLIKQFAKLHYPDSKGDLFACFIENGYVLAKNSGSTAMVTMHSWMFLSSFQNMRERLLREKAIRNLLHIGYNSFPSMNSKIAQATTFTILNRNIDGYIGSYTDLNSAPQSANKMKTFLSIDPTRRYHVKTSEFKKIPGSPIAYWVSQVTRKIFADSSQIYDLSISEGQNITADNDTYLRLHWEVQRCRVQPGSKWSFYAKGGAFRRWYGNLDWVVDWSEKARAHYRSHPSARIIPKHLRFREGVTWTLITSTTPSFRHLPSYATFDKGGSSLFFTNPRDLKNCLLFLNTTVATHFIKAFNSSLNLQVDDVRKLPLVPTSSPTDPGRYSQLINFSRADWDAYERSWDFESSPILTASSDSKVSLGSNYTTWVTQNRTTIAAMKRLEEENNRLFIDAYGLQDELTPEVPIEEITLTVNPAYRYSGKLTEEEQWARFRQDTMKELISYAIGCLMGRYSLDEPGLIYAHSGNQGFDSSRYTTFPADDDGIVPLTAIPWSEDDGAHRIEAFLTVAWDADHLEENLTFLADNLSPKGNESSRDTLRRYLAVQFFKDHLKTYKKRPIYWLFSSGKQRAFQCLVYLHRYHEGTLGRMRTEYVNPLQSKMSHRLEFLAGELNKEVPTPQRKRLEREFTTLQKQQAELQVFDEKLRHAADQRIQLDLDDGVKVNYGRFGDLLAEVKAVTGKKPE